jgi:ABC-type transport system involved in multi-copper enzyme maturation permease subunit
MTAALPRLVRSELLKIRTTNTWWIFAIAVFFLTALSLTYNCLIGYGYLHSEDQDFSGASGDPDLDTQLQAQYQAQRLIVTQAANIFTSGQYFGSLFAMLLGILLITNEYHHQTATATFLTTPHRSSVVAGKLVTAMMAAAVFWALTTVIDLVVGVIFFNSQGFDNHLGDWAVQRAILFNLMVFALWAVLGVGFGALIRNQLAAVITASALYLIGDRIVEGVFQILYYVVVKKTWILVVQILVPSRAASVFVSPVKLFLNSPPYWVGGLVLLAYGVLAGTVGTLILRRRDIS